MYSRRLMKRIAQKEYADYLAEIHAKKASVDDKSSPKSAEPLSASTATSKVNTDTFGSPSSREGPLSPLDRSAAVSKHRTDDARVVHRVLDAKAQERERRIKEAQARMMVTVAELQLARRRLDADRESPIA
eukprot:TRINITY_DN340_c0_g1_i1.p1 TRINITY_DN340_c0_g1~~TRINITY_DN340_c0_g1_i1.p1  ORF type:complete len:131 (-),score=15.87 TRINITY_DN340_c0_g1_i1:50-442(-)